MFHLRKVRLWNDQRRIRLNRTKSKSTTRGCAQSSAANPSKHAISVCVAEISLERFRERSPASPTSSTSSYFHENVETKVVLGTGKITTAAATTCGSNGTCDGF